ncbi:unnamed protein product [Strongylus vulgaris]|uniref:Uncharacterized protein n=1 Tax=Strongylus vulgaris TaxID=40348 RepID=A0A3P7JED2_STRVU|nr:unnamed protein product [Strongylus vulgaris]
MEHSYLHLRENLLKKDEKGSETENEFPFDSTYDTVVGELLVEPVGCGGGGGGRVISAVYTLNATEQTIPTVLVKRRPSTTATVAAVTQRHRITGYVRLIGTGSAEGGNMDEAIECDQATERTQ